MKYILLTMTLMGSYAMYQFIVDVINNPAMDDEEFQTMYDSDWKSEQNG